MNALIAPRCAVCGTDLGARVRPCRRCDTLYHSDCWDYNGGCAIYGCRRAARRAASGHAKDGEVPGAWQASVFGASIGVAAVSAFFHTARLVTWETLFFVACAALVGAVNGPWFRNRRDGRRIAFAGLIAPGLAASLLGLPLVIRDGALDRALLMFPFVVLYGMVTAPAAIPCAIVAARYNDPELARPGRARRWLVIAVVMAAAMLASLTTRFR